MIKPVDTIVARNLVIARTVNSVNQSKLLQSRGETLGVQALIDGKVLCVHGGLSPDLRTLDQACRVWLLCLYMVDIVHGCVIEDRLLAVCASL